MDLRQFKDKLTQQPLTVVYVSTNDCAVCDSLKPKVAALVQDHPKWTLFEVKAQESLEVAGQLLVLMAPAILLFIEGKEAARFGRNMGLQELDHALTRFGKFG